MFYCLLFGWFPGRFFALLGTSAARAARASLLEARLQAPGAEAQGGPGPGVAAAGRAEGAVAWFRFRQFAWS